MSRLIFLATGGNVAPLYNGMPCVVIGPPADRHYDKKVRFEDGVEFDAKDDELLEESTHTEEPR